MDQSNNAGSAYSTVPYTTGSNQWGKVKQCVVHCTLHVGRLKRSGGGGYIGTTPRCKFFSF